MTPKRNRAPRVLAISSGGGHWVQLRRLAPAFDGSEVVFATVDRSAAQSVAPARVYLYPDANKDQKLRLVLASLRVQDSFVERMEEASNELAFERAAGYRDRIRALNHIQAHQGI
ncbi:MAG: UvrB/UvrC motif-containing protein, partial [Pseudomonadota bacterium]